VGNELPVMKPREVIAVLQRAGWTVDRQKGSHLILVNAAGTAGVTIPMHTGDLAPGTLRSIVKQSGMTVAAFNELRRG
jgi:predicted RNA binding protein YcfA (HicA-like mRNA interferase family)